MDEPLYTLPPLPLRSIRTLLVALDELPGKFSRVLYDQITGHVDEQVKRESETGGPTLEDCIERAGYPRMAGGTGILASMGGDQRPPGTADTAESSNTGFVDSFDLVRSPDPAALSGAG